MKNARLTGNDEPDSNNKLNYPSRRQKTQIVFLTKKKQKKLIMTNPGIPISSTKTCLFHGRNGKNPISSMKPRPRRGRNGKKKSPYTAGGKWCTGAFLWIANVCHYGRYTPSSLRVAISLSELICFGPRPSFTAIAAAVPAACPIAKHGGMTRMAAITGRSAAAQRPATRRLSTFRGRRAR